MSEINLTYCPEGGEHEWELWYDEEESDMIVDCDRCHGEALRQPVYTESFLMAPLPVQLVQEFDQPVKILSRRQV